MSLTGLPRRSTRVEKVTPPVRGYRKVVADKAERAAAESARAASRRARKSEQIESKGDE